MSLPAFSSSATLQMSLVGLFVKAKHFVSVKPVKFFGAFLKKAVAQNQLGRIIIFLIIKTVNTAKIRNPAFGAHACTAKKHNSSAFVNNALKLFKITHIYTLFQFKYALCAENVQRAKFICL